MTIANDVFPEAIEYFLGQAGGDDLDSDEEKVEKAASFHRQVAVVFLNYTRVRLRQVFRLVLPVNLRCLY